MNIFFISEVFMSIVVVPQNPNSGICKFGHTKRSCQVWAFVEQAKVGFFLYLSQT